MQNKFDEFQKGLKFVQNLQFIQTHDQVFTSKLNNLKLLDLDSEFQHKIMEDIQNLQKIELKNENNSVNSEKTPQFQSQSGSDNNKSPKFNSLSISPASSCNKNKSMDNSMDTENFQNHLNNKIKTNIQINLDQKFFQQNMLNDDDSPINIQIKIDPNKFQLNRYYKKI